MTNKEGTGDNTEGCHQEKSGEEFFHTEQNEYTDCAYSIEKYLRVKIFLQKLRPIALDGVIYTRDESVHLSFLI